MAKEETLSSKLVFEGRAFKLRVDTVKTADSRETTREVVEHPDCIAVIAVDDKNYVLLERQYRQSIGKELLEIPAGGIEPGESPEEAVRRELQEEIGFLPKNVKLLSGFYSAPGYSTEYLYLYLATELVPSQLYAEDTAVITVVKTPVDKIPALLKSDEVRDAKTIAGLYAYLAYRKV
jgi:ADP-ribose pyrophosphatase